MRNSVKFFHGSNNKSFVLGAPERFDDSWSSEDRQPGYGSSSNSFDRVSMTTALHNNTCDC